MPNFISGRYTLQQGGITPVTKQQDVWPYGAPPAGNMDGVIISGDGIFTVSGWMDVPGDGHSHVNFSAQINYKQKAGQTSYIFAVKLASDEVTLKQGDKYTDKTVKTVSGDVPIGSIIGAILEVRSLNKLVVKGSYASTEESISDTTTERTIRYLTGGATMSQVQ